MSFADDVQGVVLRLVEILDAHGIDYLMMGGIAVPIWAGEGTLPDADIERAIRRKRDYRAEPNKLTARD